MKEQYETMDSFIDHALQNFEDIRQDVVKVQEYAAKYGYQLSEDKTFKPLDRDVLEAEAVAQERAEEIIRIRKISKSTLSNNDNVITHNYNEEKLGTPSKMDEAALKSNDTNSQVAVTSQGNAQSDTPKLIEIGLSKDTLKQIGFTFKEAATSSKSTRKLKGHQTRPENAVEEVENEMLVNLDELSKVNGGPKKRQAAGSQIGKPESISSDGDSPPISILKVAVLVYPAGP